MRVDFMNPVQQVMASASHFGVAMYARDKAEKAETARTEKEEERSAVEQEKLKQKSQYMETMGKFAEAKKIKAETDQKIKYAQAGLTAKGNVRRPRKPKNAEEGISNAFETGSSNRNAVVNRSEIQKEFKRFGSGEIDLSSLKEG